MVSILINIINHERYFFSFHATSCSSLMSYHRVNNKCNNSNNKKYNCSGLPAFKSQSVGYQSNQKLLHHYQH